MIRIRLARKITTIVGQLFLCLSFASHSFAAAQKPNLVLITVDSARADRMGFLGAKSTTSPTPNLDRLAAESIVFEHAYAQAPGTIVSHATILSGAYPQSTGMSEIGGTLTTSLPYLPDLLKSQGYHTAAFVSSINLDPQNGLAQGFDRGFEMYDAGFRPVIPGDLHPPVTERRGDQVTARALAWLDHNTQGEFFLWVHISDARAGDAAVGKLVSALQQNKIYGKTAVIVAGSLGESLGAHGEARSGVFLYDETIHVPLLMKLPETEAATKPSTTQVAGRVAGRVAGKVRLVDIAPTVLEIAAIPVPSQMSGQSLLRAAKSGGGASNDQPVYSRSDLPQRGFGWSPLESWRVRKYLYIRAPKPELYDLTADPSAAHDLSQSSKAILNEMASQLDNFDRRFSGEAGKGCGELSSSEMQKLASLGYAGLSKTSCAAAPVAGTDPKSEGKIAIANKVIEAAAGDPSKPERAIAALGPIVAADANLYLAEYTLGTALAQRGQYAEAVKHLHRAIELQPDAAWAHYAIGAALVKTADYKTAIIHLEIATGRLSAFAPAHAALATAYDHLGRAEDAKREKSKAGQK
ncbi:MAG TPA: sulfatase-like hydrolase/transferase [Terriglobales bacterium]|nr:sulfatase-like hydrolase/transferase [Terriglobales bacterium]